MQAVFDDFEGAFADHMFDAVEANEGFGEVGITFFVDGGNDFVVLDIGDE